MVSALIVFFGCTKDQNQANINTPAPVDVLKVKKDIQKTLQEIQSHQGVSTDVQTRVAGAFIVVPGGSVDAIKQALSDAGVGGVVYLRAGTHTENSNLVITSQAIIVGEAGSILNIKSAPSIPGGDGLIPLNPAIHIMNAPSSAVLGVTINPLGGDGSTGILFENSPLSASMYNAFNGFQYSIVVQNSDNPTIFGNKIVGSTLSARGGVGLELGILVMNGKSAYLAQNDVSGNLAGLFLCDKYGTATQNNLHNNVFGVILCRIQDNTFKLPSGQAAGAISGATNWKINTNTSSNNLAEGFEITDGSTGNIIQNNTTSGNTSFDIDLTGVTSRAGFLAKSSVNNSVTAGPTQKVIDCGQGNTVTGGIIDKTTPCN